MTDTTQRRIPWLHIGGAAALAAGIAVLVLGIIAASGAETDREDAEAAVAVQRDAVAVAETELAAAQTDLEAAEEAAAEAAGELTDREAQLADTQAALEAIEEAVPAFLLAASQATSEATDVYTATSDLAAQQRARVEAVLAEDYDAYNQLRASYLESTGTVGSRIEDLATQVESIPDVPIGDPYEYLGATVQPVQPPELVELDPPTGPAVITAVLPDEIPCSPRGEGGCRYSWEVAFQESNWLEVDITRIAIRYWAGGNRWCASTAGEWRDASITVPAGGRDTYGNWVILYPDETCGWALGTTLLFRWEGTDAEGNRLSGRVTASLEDPG